VEEWEHMEEFVCPPKSLSSAFSKTTKKRNNMKIRVDPCVLFVEGYFLFEQEIGSLFLWEEIKRSLFSLNTIRYKDYRTIRFVFSFSSDVSISFEGELI